MRREQGYAVLLDPVTKKVIKEASVFKCAHCARMIHTKTLRSHDYTTCQNCEDGSGRGLICNDPKCRSQCTPFMRAIEEAEAKAKFRSML